MWPLVKKVEKILEPDVWRTNKSSRSRRQISLVRVQVALLLVVVSDYFKFSDSLRFTSIQMPALVQRGTNFWLSCQYELAGSLSSTGHATLDDSDVTGARVASVDEQLYSVKWYKNNEEFYRLIFTSGGTTTNQQLSPSFSGDGQQQQQQQQQPFGGAGQQQCFTQPGVNVLMSSSNATHVRLLNASLETDGSYACEISTQNLSTIRFEKEIKVYVLPSSKLNLIGLRGLYSLGDRVELNCLSDFSRPAAALSWFINGRRVITTGPSARFQLEPQLTKPKANEPKLTRSSLALKFKLTNEILTAAASMQTWNLLERIANSDNNNNSSTQTTTTSNKRNQSKLLLLKSSNGNIEQPAESSRRLSTSSTGLKLVELLKLECRYKLTEVSDVTFSELRVANNEQPAPTSGVDGAHPVVAAASGGGLVERRLRKRSRAPSMRQTRRGPTSTLSVGHQQSVAATSGHRHSYRLGLAKSSTNQVHQTSCPARRDELAALLGSTTRTGACRSGLLALQREDPVILEPDDDNEEQDDDGGEAEEEEETNDGHKANVRLAGGGGGVGQLKLAVGSAIAINCSTLGALSVVTTLQQPAAFVNNSARRRRLRPTSDNDDQEERNNANQNDGQQSVIYCDDIEARKRLLVSGKYQDELHWNEWPRAALPNQRHKSSLLAKHKRHHVAYVSFEATRMNSTSAATNSNNNNNNGRRQQQARATPLGDHDDKLSLSNLNGAADSSNLNQLEGALKSLDQLHNNIELDSSPNGNSNNNNNNMQQSAPPLLEWFINNQEAPKSSASYWPEIPLTTSAKRQQVASSSYAYHGQPSGLQQPENEESTQLPSIDYREYFANFDARTNDQHLMLRLTLDKKHFMTPDSLLKLRCTSTQAEVLAVDSLEVSLYAIPTGANLSADQVNHQQERHTSLSNWNQRSASKQIKSKYLHRQQLAKSAGQHSLDSNGIEHQRHLLARPTSTANGGASSTDLLWPFWTIVVCAWLMCLISR